MRGADFERMRRRREQCHSHGSYGRRGLVEMVCAPRKMEEERLTVPFSGSLSRNHRGDGIRTHHIRQSEDSVGRQGGGGDTD